MRTFWYYEEGKPQRVSMRKAFRMFRTVVSTEQKERGTTFEMWLQEMLRMQIFCN